MIQIRCQLYKQISKLSFWQSIRLTFFFFCFFLPFFLFLSFFFYYLHDTMCDTFAKNKIQEQIGLTFPKKVLHYYSPFNDADTWFHQKLCLYKSFAACFLLPTFCCFWTCLGILFRLGFYPCKHWLWLRHYLACFKASPFRILLMK